MSKDAQLNAQNEIHKFGKFAFKERLVDVAIAFIMGVAFQKTVTSLSNNLIMPFLNFFISKTGTNWRKIEWVPFEGMTLEIGQCLGTFLDFFLISLIIYIIYIKIIKQVLVKEETRFKTCPFCASKISVFAERCGLCTSWLTTETTNE